MRVPEVPIWPSNSSMARGPPDARLRLVPKGANEVPYDIQPGWWMRWCMAPSHPPKYPLTHRIHSGIHSLTSGNCATGEGGGLHALKGVRGVRGVATTSG